MANKEEFFVTPREWSRLKYKILDKYVAQYLPKINQKFGACVIADLFAGKGKFDDGTDGSPLIIVRHAKTYKEKLGCSNQVVLAEADPEFRRELQVNLDEYVQQKIATILPGDANDVGQQLLDRIKPGVPLLVFLDPFGIKGLSMPLLLDIFRRAKSECTEVLINFNHRALSRQLGKYGHISSKNSANQKQAAGVGKLLDNCLGGHWWEEIYLSTSLTETQKVGLIKDKYIDLYRPNFKWVGSVPVKTPLDDGNPKYYLIFASRSYVAFELMNDVVRKSQVELAAEELEKMNLGTLFGGTDGMEFLPMKLLADLPAVAASLLQESQKLYESKIQFVKNGALVRIKRPELRARLIKKSFGVYTSSEMNGAIKMLLLEKRLMAENNKTSISDDATLNFPEEYTTKQLSA